MAAGGYAWWYVDALSDDGRHGITLIVFLGSVFSPYYRWARRRAPADPLHHCALNVALYGSGGKRWALTERGRSAVERSASALAVGPSTLSWDGQGLTVRIDEIAAPLPSRIRGTVRVRPEGINERRFTLDPAGRHRWRPIAPCSRVEVELDRPSLRWSGSGYLDTNEGDEPLEDAFTSWDWSRTGLRDGAAILYDARWRDGGSGSIALRCKPSGEVEDMASPPAVDLPRTRWRLARTSRAEAGGAARIVRSLEDAPFYARSVLTTRLLGQEAMGVHESLSLTRFVSLPVQLMIPFRMPRAWR